MVNMGIYRKFSGKDIWIDSWDHSNTRMPYTGHTPEKGCIRELATPLQCLWPAYCAMHEGLSRRSMGHSLSEVRCSSPFSWTSSMNECKGSWMWECYSLPWKCQVNHEKDSFMLVRSKRLGKSPNKFTNQLGIKCHVWMAQVCCARAWSIQSSAPTATACPEKHGSPEARQSCGGGRAWVSKRRKSPVFHHL
jgi:hypothetical protein